LILLLAAFATAADGVLARLADPSPTVRAAAAAELLAAPLPDEGAARWPARVAQVLPGTPRHRVEALLPTVEPGFGTMSRGGATVTWRLDPWWSLTTSFDEDGLTRAAPSLNREAQSIWVAPPATFSGVWLTYYVTGHPSQTIHYADGAYSGPFTTQYDDARPKVQQHYRGGVAHGPDTGMHHNGTKAYTGAYLDGARHGVWTHWYADGGLQSRETVEHGALHGTREMWFEGGGRRSEVHYEHGEKHGLDRAWDEQGTLLWERRFVRGVMQ
jgi:hypothetical protein